MAAGEEEPHKFTVDWDELPDYVALRVDQEKLRELVEKAREKVGGTAALEKKGIVHANIQVKILKDKMDVITVRKLKGLLDYLGISYDEMNVYIKGIGSRTNPDKMRNPRLPFDFNSEEGAIILAAALKDGSVYTRGKARFEYANKDRKNRERVKRAVERVFGDVKPDERVLPSGTYAICYRSLAIVNALRKMGIPAGRKVEQKYHVPKVVLEGSKDVKKAYLYQTMMDEGSWISERHIISYGQTSSLSVEGLSEKEREYLDRLLSKEGRTPTGHIERFAIINKDLKGEMEREHPNLWRAIEKSEPPYMGEEAKMLREVCGVELEPKLERIYVTEKGRYRVIWKIKASNKEDFEKIKEVYQIDNGQGSSI